LVVDEEKDVLDQVKAYLDQEDVIVITATDSRHALSQLFRENEETFDLILINTRMPGSTTRHALFSLKPTLKKLPTIREDFLEKPFTKEQLLEFVKRNL
jgi:DNA-binding response OmpR family regulator